MCLRTIAVFLTDYFVQFGEGVGREVGELGKLWEGVLGRYDKAVERLVTDTLCESENPVEKLANAVIHMKTPESANRALQAVQKGKNSICVLCILFSIVLFPVAIISLDCLSALLQIEDICPLGQLLGVSEDTLAAIESYYDERAHKIRHTVAVWLMNDPNDPIAMLIDALNENKISQALYLLSSFGELNSSCLVFMYYQVW